MDAARRAALEADAGAPDRSATEPDALASVDFEWAPESDQFALDAHLRQSAIDELREGLPVMPWWEPTSPRDRFLNFGLKWATYTRTCLARQIGALRAKPQRRRSCRLS